MDLLLVRHAEPVRIEDAPGPADPPLAERGRTQAEACARWLSFERLHAVVASPLRRAVQTAEPIAAAFGLPVEIDDDLAEFDREAASYIPVEELRAAKDPRWTALTEDRWDELAQIDRDTFRRLVIDAVERVIRAHPGQRAAVICHGGVINIYLAEILGIPRDLWFEPAYTSISRVAASRAGVRSVVSINETAHLRDLDSGRSSAP